MTTLTKRVPDCLGLGYDQGLCLAVTPAEMLTQQLLTLKKREQRVRADTVIELERIELERNRLTTLTFEVLP